MFGKSKDSGSHVYVDNAADESPTQTPQVQEPQGEIVEGAQIESEKGTLYRYVLVSEDELKMGSITLRQ